MARVTIYYQCSWPHIRRIQRRFGLPTGVTVNGETPTAVDISDEDMELLRETERRGYIQIRNKQK